MRRKEIYTLMISELFGLEDVFLYARTVDYYLTGRGDPLNVYIHLGVPL